MEVILGRKDWKEKDGNGKEISKHKILTCEIPNTPTKLSDFPKGSTAAIVPSATTPGMLSVVTVDGKRFTVAGDSKTAKE